MGWSDPNRWTEARRAEAEARDAVTRDVLGFDPDVDLDEDGHAFDGYGARRFGTVLPRTDGPYGQPMDFHRVEALWRIGEEDALDWGGFTHPDWVAKLDRHQRRGR